MSERTCSIRGCKKKLLAKGLCSAHYSRAWRAGALPPVQLEIPLSPRHQLTNVDRASLTAVCEVCGPDTPIHFRAGRKSAECQIKRKAAFARLKEMTAALPASEQQAVKKRQRLRKRYGITPEDYEYLMSQQKGLCAICQQTGLKLVVDHNHVTGKVRGLLCRNCNLALGNLRDSPKTAIAASEYLQSR